MYLKITQIRNKTSIVQNNGQIKEITKQNINDPKLLTVKESLANNIKFKNAIIK